MSQSQSQDSYKDNEVKSDSKKDDDAEADSGEEQEDEASAAEGDDAAAEKDTDEGGASDIGSEGNAADAEGDKQQEGSERAESDKGNADNDSADEGEADEAEVGNVKASSSNNAAATENKNLARSEDEEAATDSDVESKGIDAEEAQITSGAANGGDDEGRREAAPEQDAVSTLIDRAVLQTKNCPPEKAQALASALRLITNTVATHAQEGVDATALQSAYKTVGRFKEITELADGKLRHCEPFLRKFPGLFQVAVAFPVVTLCGKLKQAYQGLKRPFSPILNVAAARTVQQRLPPALLQLISKSVANSRNPKSAALPDLLCALVHAGSLKGKSRSFMTIAAAMYPVTRMRYLPLTNLTKPLGYKPTTIFEHFPLLFEVQGDSVRLTADAYAAVREPVNANPGELHKEYKDVKDEPSSSLSAMASEEPSEQSLSDRKDDASPAEDAVTALIKDAISKSRCFLPADCEALSTALRLLTNTLARHPEGVDVERLKRAYKLAVQPFVRVTRLVGIDGLKQYERFFRHFPDLFEVSIALHVVSLTPAVKAIYARVRPVNPALVLPNTRSSMTKEMSPTLAQLLQNCVAYVPWDSQSALSDILCALMLAVKRLLRKGPTQQGVLAYLQEARGLPIEKLLLPLGYNVVSIFQEFPQLFVLNGESVGLTDAASEVLRVRSVVASSADAPAKSAVANSSWDVKDNAPRPVSPEEDSPESPRHAESSQRPTQLPELSHTGRNSLRRLASSFVLAQPDTAELAAALGTLARILASCVKPVTDKELLAATSAHGFALSKATKILGYGGNQVVDFLRRFPSIFTITQRRSKPVIQLANAKDMLLPAAPEQLSSDAKDAQPVARTEAPAASQVKPIAERIRESIASLGVAENKRAELIQALHTLVAVLSLHPDGTMTIDELQADTKHQLVTARKLLGQSTFLAIFELLPAVFTVVTRAPLSVKLRTTPLDKSRSALASAMTVRGRAVLDVSTDELDGSSANASETKDSRGDPAEVEPEPGAHETTEQKGPVAAPVSSAYEAVVVRTSRGLGLSPASQHIVLQGMLRVRDILAKHPSGLSHLEFKQAAGPAFKLKPVTTLLKLRPAILEQLVTCFPDVLESRNRRMCLRLPPVELQASATAGGGLTSQVDADTKLVPAPNIASAALLGPISSDRNERPASRASESKGSSRRASSASSASGLETKVPSIAPAGPADASTYEASILQACRDSGLEVATQQQVVQGMRRVWDILAPAGHRGMTGKEFKQTAQLASFSLRSVGKLLRIPKATLTNLTSSFPKTFESYSGRSGPALNSFCERPSGPAASNMS